MNERNLACIARLASGDKFIEKHSAMQSSVLLLLSIMLNAMFLGIVGEYVGRIFLQSKRNSLPIVEVCLNRPEREDETGKRDRDGEDRTS